MGRVSEYEGMENVSQNESIFLMKTQVNQATELSIQAIPSIYGVYINDDLVFSCNIIKNAEMLYRVIRADLVGKAWCETY